MIVRGFVVQARHAKIEFKRRDALEAAALEVMDSYWRANRDAMKLPITPWSIADGSATSKVTRV